MKSILLLSVLLPLAAAPGAYALRGREALSDRLCSALTLLIGGLTAALCFAPPAEAAVPGAFLLGLSFRSGGLGGLLALLCAFMFFMSSLANPAYFRGEGRRERYRAFLLLTLSGMLGVFYAGDLLTLYVFFELMSLASWVWVAHNENPRAERAADTYLAMAMIGGLVMLYGLFRLQRQFGTLDIPELQALAGEAGTEAVLVPALCLLTGFGVKAGMFPFHVWLPKAHPVAPAPASALLSGILTKSGIYGILLVSCCLLFGEERFALLLLLLGSVTMVLGALLALFSMDLKRTLACSSLSQIGFILLGVSMLTLGTETELAAGGVLAHAVNHALTKLCLFLIAGVIYKERHSLALNELRGAGRGNLPLTLCFLAGGLSLAGVPGFGGYISKTLLHEGLVHQMGLHGAELGGVLKTAEQLFLFSGGLTLAYMAKLFVKLFLEKPLDGRRAVRADGGSLLAVTVPAAALLLMGLFPGLSYERLGARAAASLRTLPFHAAYYSLENLKGAGISLCIGALLYLIVVRGILTRRKDGCYTPPASLLDVEDDIYRPLLRFLSFAGALAARLCYSLTDAVVQGAVLLFSRGAGKPVEPGQDSHFSRYSRQYVRVNPIKQTLQFELLLFGIGVLLIVAYLLLQLRNS